MRRPYQKYTEAQRIGSVADYLIGMKVQHIEAKWGVRMPSVMNWLRKVECFKTRRIRESKC